MIDSRAASRYAKSLIGLAIEQNVLDQVHADMQLFTKVCQENKAFVLMLRNPVIRHDKKRNILESLFKGKVHPLTMAILDIITHKNREPLLPAIAQQFHSQFNEYKSIGGATVTTAVPLDNELRAEFQKIAKQLTDRKQVQIVEKIDPNMIGGFILKVGDRQIDASIKSKLKALQVDFSHNPYIKEF